MRNEAEREAFDGFRTNIVMEDTRATYDDMTKKQKLVVLLAYRYGAAYQRTQAQPADALVEALDELVKINENHNKAVQEIIGGGVTLGWKDSYLDKAREALATYRAAQEKK